MGGDRVAVVDTEFPAEDKFDHLGEPKRGARPCARGDGIPHGPGRLRQVLHLLRGSLYRGSETSRPVARILAEAEALVAAGVREITLLGQNVNAYHGTGEDGRPWTLGGLLRRLSRIEGLDRLRYTTSHPRDMDDDLVAAHRELGSLMPYLHLPVQSGSDRILAAMNRRHTADDYLRLVDRVRAARPDIALSGDVIVGFPARPTRISRTRCGWSSPWAMRCFSFKYSPRPGTPAADLDGQVPDAVKTERLATLQALLRRQEVAFADSLVGRTLDVLFEKAGRLPGQVVGRSPYLQPVHVSGPATLIGTIAPVIVERTGTHSLFGRLRDGDTVAPARSA